MVGRQNKIRPLLLYIIVVVVALIVYGLIELGYAYEWTGFASYTSPPTPENQEFQRAKTLWDWLGLLLIPTFLAIGAWILNQASQQTQLEIETDRQRQTALEAYFDHITNLLLEKKLREDTDKTPRIIARTRTLAILKNLDSSRKSQLLQFLYEAGLISKEPIINLTGAEIRDANLNAARLMGAELQGVNLSKTLAREANLEGANFWGSNLTEADLTGANLNGANFEFAISKGAKFQNIDLRTTKLKGIDLTKANLTGSKIEPEQIEEIGSLRDAIMPDGKIYRG